MVAQTDQHIFLLLGQACFCGGIMQEKKRVQRKGEQAIVGEDKTINQSKTRIRFSPHSVAFYVTRQQNSTDCEESVG